MQKPYSVAQFYGYSVCLVSVVAVLIALPPLVGALVELSDPLHGSRYASITYPNLSSFEAYKVDTLVRTRFAREPAEAPYVPDEQTLRAMYEAAKAERIQSTRLQAHRALIMNSLLAIVSILLFAVHWSWLNRLARAEIQATK